MDYSQCCFGQKVLVLTTEKPQKQSNLTINSKIYCVSATTAFGEPRVYFQQPDTAEVIEFAWFSRAWHTRGIFSETSDTSSDPSTDVLFGSSIINTITVNNGTEPRVYFLSTEGKIMELGWFNGRWNISCLFDAIKGNNIAVGSLLPEAVISSVSCNGSPKIYYRSSSNGICEIQLNSQWTHNAISQNLSQHSTFNQIPNVAIDGTPITSLSVNETPRVYYKSQTAGKIIELCPMSDNNWHIRNLSDETNSPPCSHNGSISCTTIFCHNSNQDPRIYFRSEDGHIHELAWANNWLHRDLTQEFQTPLVSVGHGKISAITLKNGEPRVYYVASDSGHVIELCWSENWSFRDLTSELNAPFAIQQGTISAITLGNGDPRVYFIQEGNKVAEFSWWSSSWHYILLSP